MSMTKLRIDIVSDIVCPWCIIGYKQVEKALGLLENPVEAEIWWHPFELNPDMPEEGEDIASHVMRKYGSTPEQGRANRKRLSELGESLGFAFNHGASDGGGKRIFNTFKAHKLLSIFANERGPAAQTKLKLALFAAYFQEGRDVSDDAVLLDIAEANGMARDVAKSWIADDPLTQAVRHEQAEWRDRDIQGVPAIIFDSKFMVPGAQSAETFANVIGKVLAKRDAANS